MKILIVDDNPDSVEYISRILSEYDSKKILRAYDGKTAIKITMNKHPDLILLDVMMPDINGFKVCEILSAEPSTEMIPIIMVTAKTSLKDLETGLESGAFDYIRKPFESAELLARVRVALRFKRSQTELIDTKRRLESMNEELAQLAITDSLTQIYNHTFLLNTLKFEFNRSERFSEDMAFLMMDIDHFKSINDTYGHLVGDEILKEVVKIIKAQIRAIDILGRYGGEEFGLILPETDENGALILAEKIRKKIEKNNFLVKSGEDTVKVKITVSIGVSTYPDKNIKDIITLIKRADDALYISKDQGRNRIYKIN
jgi:diguanylate cyclase (GGDEF)-like protein